MVDRKRLLEDLKRVLKRLEDDLRERMAAVPEMAERLRDEYRAARDAGRTGTAFEVWREEVLTQAAAAWILGCVFVRFMEDNELLDEPLISGPGERRSRAADRQTLYFQSHPTDTDRDYLYDAFRAVARLPAVAKLYDQAHNPLWAYGISGDAAKELIAFWRRVVPETGALVHDFTDPGWNTRFLGDLYQDLSETARKRYALLQTPAFVEEFILDRTLDPAIEEFRLKEVRLIDPTCGSGHFILGAFRRLLDRWFKKEPGTPERALVQRALDGVYGVDINPYAVAIARFRLLVEALKASSIRRLKEAPGYRINVTAGDSLLHGRRFGELDLGSGADQLGERPGIGHAFLAEDLDELNRILGQQYHAVVGNPPYITVKDRAVNQLYRERYSQSCHMKYALSVPFTERFFELAVGSDHSRRAGYVGMITANSFMKREFGKKLVEGFLPRVDFTHVIDTSGAYIPGHGTPTVIMFGRERRPVAPVVRTVMGIKGEPGTPQDAAQGKVWAAIVGQVDQANSESEWVSVADTPRETFARHPWSIGGGGTVNLKEAIDQIATNRLAEQIAHVGFMAITGEDEAFVFPGRIAVRMGSPYRQFVLGDMLRDWGYANSDAVLFPYVQGESGSPHRPAPILPRFLYTHHRWRLRTPLRNRSMFGKTIEEHGHRWDQYIQFIEDRVSAPLLIAFAEVATHNHFVLDRGGKVFKQTAPVIKLPAGATEADHLALLGLLNSSTACFWGRQVMFPKGGFAAGKWEERLAWNSMKVDRFPIREEKPLSLATELDRLARERQAHLPAQLVDRLPMTRAELDARHAEAERLLRCMIALQEELDWRCYTLYCVTDQDLCYRDAEDNHLDPPPVDLGQRAFEMLMARQMARGELSSTWFERHRSKPITEIPTHWPEDYRRLVERRIALIGSDRYLGLIERPEHKRRWNQEPWEAQEQRALRGWLLNRLETGRYWPEPRLQSTRQLADRAQTDADFVRVAELYVGHPGFDVPALVAGLVEGESVPFLPVLRYKPSGLRKREVWEQTWELQRREDAIDAEVEASTGDANVGLRSANPTYESGEDVGWVRRDSAVTQQNGASDLHQPMEEEKKRRKKEEVGDIPPPPKYQSADFLSATCWRLRGALDVPKERFVSYPHCSRDNDPALVVGWAGSDHLQQAQALAGYYTQVIEQEGWAAERLKPLLAGLAELLPWLKQWHNHIDPTFNEPMGDFFQTFLHSELQKHGLTRHDLRHWQPSVSRGGRTRKVVRTRTVV